MPLGKPKHRWKITLVFAPPIPWNGNFHSFSIFSTLMASISELCRGLSIPSINVFRNVFNGQKRDNIFFVFPSLLIMPYMIDRRYGRNNFYQNFALPWHIWKPYNTLVNRWVKLSIAVERQMPGYVSIKLRERSLV